MFRKNMKFITTSSIVIMLLAAIFGFSQPIANAAGKPGIISRDCGNLYDHIQDLRQKGGGVMTEADQKNLDNAVSAYNTYCKGTFGGNPRVTGGGAGVSQEGGQTLDSGEKATKKDFSKATGMISGLQNSSQNLGNMTSLPSVTITNSSMVNTTAPATNSTNSTASLINGNASQTNLAGSVGQNPPGNITGTGRRH